MENINGIFDALYLRLILRDFFGKVVPGTIVYFFDMRCNFFTR